MSGGERKKNKSKNELYYISFHPSDSSNLNQKILFCSLQDSQIPDKSQTTLVKPLCLCRDLYPSNLSEFDCFHVVLLERCWTAQLWRWARPLINHFCRNIAAMKQMKIFCGNLVETYQEDLFCFSLFWFRFRKNWHQGLKLCHVKAEPKKGCFLACIISAICYRWITEKPIYYFINLVKSDPHSNTVVSDNNTVQKVSNQGMFFACTGT